jgi:hypothetical protein
MKRASLFSITYYRRNMVLAHLHTPKKGNKKTIEQNTYSRRKSRHKKMQKEKAPCNLCDKKQEDYPVEIIVAHCAFNSTETLWKTLCANPLYKMFLVLVS